MKDANILIEIESMANRFHELCQDGHRASVDEVLEYLELISPHTLLRLTDSIRTSLLFIGKILSSEEWKEVDEQKLFELAERVVKLLEGK